MPTNHGAPPAPDVHSAATSTHRHRELLEALATLREEAGALRSAPAAERGPRAQPLYRRLALFAGDELLHMAHEESHGSRLLRCLYGSAGLAEIHGRLQTGLRATPPAS